jgi:hypothetical protein
MSSGKQSSSKRKAAVAGMDLLDQKPATKKTRRETALETRLSQLKRAFVDPDELPPEWEDYDPGHFMEGMRRMSRQVNALTLETVGEYIKDRLQRDLTTLDIRERRLTRPVTPGFLDPEDLELTQTVRRQMIEYVVGVRTCLNGQS